MGGRPLGRFGENMSSPFFAVSEEFFRFAIIANNSGEPRPNYTLNWRKSALILRWLDSLFLCKSLWVSMLSEIVGV